MCDCIPPRNIRAEQVVLGCMLTNRLCVHNIQTLLNADDFYREAHREIYEAMMTLYDKKEEVDIITVTDILRTANKLEDVGGIPYITFLANAYYTEPRFWACARTVADKAKQRRNELLLLEIRSLLEDILKEVRNG